MVFIFTKKCSKCRKRKMELFKDFIFDKWLCLECFHEDWTFIGKWKRVEENS